MRKYYCRLSHWKNENAVELNKSFSKKIILNKYSSEGVLVKCVLLRRFVKNPALTQITSQEVLSNFVFDKV